MELGTILSLLLIVLLTYWSAWISSAETALFSLSSPKVSAFRTDTDSQKRLIAELLSRPRDLLVTVFMVNTFVNIMLQNVVSDMYGESGRWEYKIGIPLILILVFGEIIPKYIGLQNNLTISYRVSPTIDLLQRLLTPLRKWIISITTPLSRILFFFLRKEPEMTKEELAHILETSEKKGVVNRNEAELIQGYLKLRDSTVKEHMWPKEDIIFYDLSQPLSRLIYLFSEQELFRIPVVNKSLENMLGIITANQFFTHQNNLKSSKDLIPLLKKPFFIPETTPGRVLLNLLNDTDEVLAIVVDEYGSIAGLISKEDLIEVVIGPIEDMRDQQALYIKVDDQAVIASGKWELTELNQYFDTDLKSPSNMITVGGWLTEALGDIPKAGTKWEREGFLFHVLAANPNRIVRLYIRKIKRQPAKPKGS